MAPLITNKPAGRGKKWALDNTGHHLVQLSDHVSLCSLSPVPGWTLSGRARRAGSVFPRKHLSTLHHTVSCLLISKPALVSPSCSARLPHLTWHDVFVRPPHRQPAWHFNLHSWRCAQCHSCLAEWAPGCQAMRWHSIESKPGMLERAAKRGHNGLAVETLSGQRAWSTIDKWSIKPLVTGSDSPNLILCHSRCSVSICYWFICVGGFVVSGVFSDHSSVTVLISVVLKRLVI